MEREKAELGNKGGYKMKFMRVCTELKSQHQSSAAIRRSLSPIFACLVLVASLSASNSSSRERWPSTCLHSVQSVSLRREPLRKSKESLIAKARFSLTPSSSQRCIKKCSRSRMEPTPADSTLWTNNRYVVLQHYYYYFQPLWLLYTRDAKFLDTRARN